MNTTFVLAHIRHVILNKGSDFNMRNSYLWSNHHVKGTYLREKIDLIDNRSWGFILSHLDELIAMRSIKTMINDEERGVSPVIGVILMVAITVILAAVIASFVLGLGDETDDVSPNIVFDADYNISDSGENNTVTFTVDTADGDADGDDMVIRGDNIDGDIEWQDGVSAGDSFKIGEEDADWADESNDNIDIESGDEIVIVFETDDTSDTLDTFTVP